jgi:ADP-ribosylglycohydrolase
VACLYGVATGDAIGKPTETREASISTHGGSLAIADCCFPDNPLTGVPLALSLATMVKTAEDAIVGVANIGGDSDSVASIAGAISGAKHPGSLNRQWCNVVDHLNSHSLAATAGVLARLRKGQA